ncbi:MAG: hypothetical protein ABSG54_08210 [Terriglobia bacterium]
MKWLGRQGGMQKADARDGSCERFGAPKNFGDASLHPRSFQTRCEEAYLFFFAFFFAAIVFSSRFFLFLASRAGEARIQSHV